MEVGQAITIWVDESTEITLGNDSYNLVGYLITNSDSEEFNFLDSLKQSRKVSPSCWTCLHGSEMAATDTRKINLLDRWVTLFKNNESVGFHCFLYKRDERFIQQGHTYEHYFAKQSVFALANKMRRRNGYVVNSMFKDISTLTVLFDRRRSHAARIVRNGAVVQIDRLHELEGIYKEEISNQIHRISGKNTNEENFTVRFSFLSSECFDAMQLSDCLLYLVRKKLEQETTGESNIYTEMFDTHFLNDLDEHTKSIGFKKIYEFDKKLNFFEAHSN